MVVVGVERRALYGRMDSVEDLGAYVPEQMILVISLKVHAQTSLEVL